MAAMIGRVRTLIKQLRPRVENPETNNQALETAWKIHAALTDWTGKVDAKAAFSFALESAGLTIIVALSADGRLFGSLQGIPQHVAYYCAVAALLIAASCAMWVVMPRLRMRHLSEEWPDNFIYFGHLRYWDPSELGKKIKNTELLPILTKQLVGMSRIAWNKHLLVKTSMIFASVGGLSLLACGMFVTSGLL